MKVFFLKYLLFWLGILAEQIVFENKFVVLVHNLEIIKREFQRRALVIIIFCEVLYSKHFNSRNVFFYSHSKY